MDEAQAFKAAHAVFAAVLQNVRTEQLGDPAFNMEWRVRDLPAHVTSVTQHFGGVRIATGLDDLRAMHAALASSATVDKLQHLHTEAAEAAHEAFAAPEGLDRELEVSWWSMSLPGRTIASILAMDCVTHAWDLARSTGQPTDFEEALVEQLLVIAHNTIGPEARAPGVAQFAAEQPCDPERPAIDRLAAYLGRRVD